MLRVLIVHRRAFSVLGANNESANDFHRTLPIISDTKLTNVLDNVRDP